MSWQDVFILLRAADGRVEAIDPAKLASATAAGKGPADVQVRIAQLEYDRQYQTRKEDHGQKTWEF